MRRVHNITNLVGHGPARVLVVRGVRILPGKSHPFEDAVADKQAVRSGAKVTGMEVSRIKPKPAPRPAVTIAQTSFTAAVLPPKEVEPSVTEEEALAVLDDMAFGELVQVFNGVSPEEYGGKRSKKAARAAVAGLDLRAVRGWLEVNGG